MIYHGSILLHKVGLQSQAIDNNGSMVTRNTEHALLCFSARISNRPITTSARYLYQREHWRNQTCCWLSGIVDEKSDFNLLFRSSNNQQGYGNDDRLMAYTRQSPTHPIYHIKANRLLNRLFSKKKSLSSHYFYSTILIMVSFISLVLVASFASSFVGAVPFNNLITRQNSNDSFALSTLYI